MKSLRHIIEEAERRKIALGHFNVASLEQLKAIVNVVRRLNAPVIVGVSEGERDFIGVSQIAALIETYKNENLPIFLNADHTHSLDGVEEAAHAGFDSIIFDGAKLPLEENIKQTKEAVKIVRSISKSIVVEGELGYIGSSSEVFKELPKGAAIQPEDLTKPEEAVRYVQETKVDMLAPAVGNVHGMFQNAPNPRLDIERIGEIKKALQQAEGKPFPLVLHGGSGIKDKDFVAAIDAGISIIHISTELRLAWRRGLERSLKNHSDEVAPYKIMAGVILEMEKVIENRLKLFNKMD
jgi:fructose-bisphosphate aldolase class II